MFRAPGFGAEEWRLEGLGFWVPWPWGEGFADVQEGRPRRVALTRQVPTIQGTRTPRALYSRYLGG